jgi:hypothetical protein
VLDESGEQFRFDERDMNRYYTSETYSMQKVILALRFEQARQVGQKILSFEFWVLS